VLRNWRAEIERRHRRELGLALSTVKHISALLNILADNAPAVLSARRLGLLGE
jgi:hypothetical protein